jgi:DNA-binding response OmpR family regulator
MSDIYSAEEVAMDRLAIGTVVLVADDEVEVRDLVRQVLEPHGFRVQDASNGYEVLDRVERSKIEILILDLVMSGMEGIETLRRLRVRRPDLKILAISGAFGGSFLSCAKQLGANAALKKPFSCDSLLAEVRALLQR